jgi:hypothetical protein
MRRLTRFFNTWAAVTRIHRYADQQHEWTEEDRQVGTEVCNTCGCESQIQTREIHVNSVGE